jgi:DNA-binding NtrC family response regulator
MEKNVAVGALARGLLHQEQDPCVQTKVAKMSDKRKILIVDDDEVVRLSYLRSLESVSCGIEAASNGEEALQTMEQDPFDVVLLDMRMPGQDGLSVLRTIKQKWPASEVVIITGYPTVASAKEAVRLGAYDYLAKPMSPQDVVNVTDGAITRKNWALQRIPDTAAEGCTA